MITRTGAQGKKKGEEGNQRKSVLSLSSTLSRRCNGRDANVIAFLRSLPSFLPFRARRLSRVEAVTAGVQPQIEVGGWWW